MLKIAPSENGRKPRLPSQFAWPLGVEAISSYFANVPQYQDLQVWFSDRPVAPQWTLQRIAAEKRAYPIFTLWYAPARRAPGWYFMVYPVEIRRKSLARELLEAEGFPWIQKWLMTKQADTEMLSAHHLRCFFHPVSEGLTLEHARG